MIRDDDTEAITPVELRGEIWLKRDDRFAVAGARGGKARSCWLLARGARDGLITAGSRQSPQTSIVARIASHLGLPCRVHTPSGGLTPELADVVRHGAERIAHRAGYNSVIAARAREDSQRLRWTLIPFGMECEEAVASAARQTANLPEAAKRLVVPVGSGMTLAGIVGGLQRHPNSLAVLGVVVGADPRRRLDRWALPTWRQRVTLVSALEPYDRQARDGGILGLELDPIYEGKCLPFVEPGDCLWIVGIRPSAGSV